MISRINLLIKEIARIHIAGLGNPSRLSMRSKVFGRGESLPSTESFTEKLAIKFSSRSYGTIIGRSNASQIFCFNSAADTAATTAQTTSTPSVVVR